MSIEDINIALFHWINSTATQNLMLDKIAVFLTDGLIPLLILSLIITLFFNDKKYKWQFVKTLMIVTVSLLVTQIIHAIYYHPRPFLLGLGHLLVRPESSSSFPSQHTLLIITISFSYLVAGFIKIGVIGIIMSLIIAWSRVYVGVHFPLDVFSSVVIGFIIVYSMNFLIEKTTHVIK